jgi:Spy/CpxP family protein refolding chaperone
MRKIIPLSLALAGALGLSAMAFAGGPGEDHGPGPGFGGWHGHAHHGGDFGLGFAGLHKLDLSDAQKASIKQLVQQNFAQLKPQRDAVRQQRAAFEALTPDAAGYQSAAASLAQAEASLTSARITQGAALRAQIYAVLTSAQKTQLANLKAEREARMEQWKAFRAQHPVPAASQQSAQ